VVGNWTTFDPRHPDAMADFKLPPDPQWDPTKLPSGSALPTEKVPVAGVPGKFANPPTQAATAPMRATATNQGARGANPASSPSPSGQ